MDIPKNPIHYIEYGFAPTSALRDDLDGKSVAVTAELRKVKDNNAYTNDDVYVKHVLTIYNGYWKSDTLEIHMDNDAYDASKIDADEYHEWKFTIYPFTNPPSSKRVITKWSAMFK